MPVVLSTLSFYQYLHSDFKLCLIKEDGDINILFAKNWISSETTLNHLKLMYSAKLFIPVSVTLNFHSGKKRISTFPGSRITLNFRAGSTFPVPVCTASPGHWVQTLNSTIASATRLTQSDFRLNLLLMKGQRYVRCQCEDKILKDNVKKRYKRGSLEIMST